jgi:hypothetical protein
MFSIVRRSRLLLASLVVVAGSLVGAPTWAGATARSATAPYCGITWGSLDKSGGGLRPAALLTTRTGQHDCYDRLVFEFDGPADGFNVGYRTEVYTEGEGAPLSGRTAGGALIAVHLLEPAYDQAGHVTYAHRPGDHVADVSGYRTLRDVVYGGTFEGYTTFALGVRARLPFRVFVLPGPGSHSRIVLDVAHRW